jgi:outer membrane protein OmpA-like peptidoglycan-associated protein
MAISRRVVAPAVLCLLVIAAACSRQSAQTTTATPEPSLTAAATVEASAAASASPEAAASGAAGASPEASGTATPTPTPSPNPNLLSTQNGTVLRSYPDIKNIDPRSVVDGFAGDTTVKAPWVFVYELPGVATLTSVGARLPEKDTPDKDGSTVVFAVSTSSATSGFSDVARLTSSASPPPYAATLNNVQARWIRVTSTSTGTATPFGSISAQGTLAPRPPSAVVAGTYVEYRNPYALGAFAAAPSEADPWYLQVVTGANGTGINGQRCYDGKISDAFPGTFDGRTWQWNRTPGDGSGTFTANDEGTILVEWDGSPAYWVRTPKRPKWCGPQTVGTGPSNVLVLDAADFGLYPIDADSAKNFPGYRFTQLGAAQVDQSALAGASMVMINGLCVGDDVLAPWQDTMLAQWVSAGHKLSIHDADMCGKPTHYSLLPYPFTSNNPGARGAKGDRLIMVEDDSLGTSDKTDKAHYFDPLVYAQNGNQLGDANTVTTHDPHWCGHLFGTNVNHVNGFMQMYAPYGQGVFIYNGFDHDDDNVPSYQRVRELEIKQPIPADLPCTQKASLAFIIQPNRDATFIPGKAVSKPFAMELLANQGWKGHITMSTTGDFKASVNPSSFDIDGTTKPLKIAVAIPAGAKPGTYAVIVNGDGGNGQSAQATITLRAAIPLVKQLKQQRRIRIYGIHFDVDKATIKPQSEPVIKQIADVMKQNPTFRFRVEGHTDSDGGVAHNQVLSQHRAESVVNDLVKRYHIARSRLVPVGYGLSRPVAPNTTAAGKALNRRVELYLLNG